MSERCAAGSKRASVLFRARTRPRAPSPLAPDGVRRNTSRCLIPVGVVWIVVLAILVALAAIAVFVRNDPRIGVPIGAEGDRPYLRWGEPQYLVRTGVLPVREPDHHVLALAHRQRREVVGALLGDQGLPGSSELSLEALDHAIIDGIGELMDRDHDLRVPVQREGCLGASRAEEQHVL